VKNVENLLKREFGQVFGQCDLEDVREILGGRLSGDVTRVVKSLLGIQVRL